ncbi:hypothetical protein PVAP13_8NG033601 [Panicum virgatum]|uniref:Uncharacterized protein n=1 Tax=Panicum virgatum TaxID=38727 RepID=A0A8T0P1Y8_PANVG|nr:hypothetical protein PVAP13_8NG033601 [Panicum virgatum]
MPTRAQTEEAARAVTAACPPPVARGDPSEMPRDSVFQFQSIKLIKNYSHLAFSPCFTHKIGTHGVQPDQGGNGANGSSLSPLLASRPPPRVSTLPPSPPRFSPPPPSPPRVAWGATSRGAGARGGHGQGSEGGVRRRRHPWPGRHRWRAAQAAAMARARATRARAAQIWSRQSRIRRRCLASSSRPPPHHVSPATATAASRPASARHCRGPHRGSAGNRAGD